MVVSLGPSFGYFPNANKTWFVTKTQFDSIGKKIFGDTAVNVTSEGRPHLGAPIGTSKYVEKFTVNKVNNWILEVDTLSSIATSQLHAAYACFPMGSSANGCMYHVPFQMHFLTSNNLRMFY